MLSLFLCSQAVKALNVLRLPTGYPSYKIKCFPITFGQAYADSQRFHANMIDKTDFNGLQFPIDSYCMACVCSRYNARSDWLIVAVL